MKEMNYKLHERLRDLRVDHGLTQEDLAKICGVDHVDICRWEAKMHIPTVSSILAIAEYFDVSIDYLVGRK
ncbi:MAG: helix-turn-helix transcriptional regulator [Clostridia bacterium]|nr:helix-turn-helix transcriptional regulator [Clostridia bacterium]